MTKHWILGAKSKRAFCGVLVKGPDAFIMDKTKITCLKCVRLMKLHEHLPE